MNPSQPLASKNGAQKLEQQPFAASPSLTRAKLKPVTPLLSSRFEHKSLLQRSNSLIRNEKPTEPGLFH